MGTRLHFTSHLVSLPGIWVALTIALIAFLVRLPGLEKSLNSDEIYSLRIAEKSVSAIIVDTPIQDSHPPFYYILLHFWMMASRHEGWLRLPSVIFSSALVFVAYAIGRDAAGETFGLLTGLAMALSSSSSATSQLVRNYACYALLINLSLLWLARALDSHKTSDWLKHIVATILAIYTFYFSLLVILLNNVFILLFHPKKCLTRPWILSQVVIFFCFLPLAVSFLHQAASVNQVSASDNQSITLATALKNHVYIALANLPGIDYRLVLPPLPVLKIVWPLTLCLIALKSTVAFLKENPPILGLCLVHVFGIFPLALLLQRANLLFVHRYYFAYVIPWLFIFILAGACGAYKKTKWACAAIGILLCSNLMGLADLYATPSEEFRAATAYIDQLADDDDLVCTVADFVADCYQFYSDRSLETVGLPRDIPGTTGDMTMHDDGVSVVLSDLFNEHDSVWMMYSHVMRGPMDRGKDKAREILMQNGFRLDRELSRRFPGVEVELFRAEQSSNWGSVQIPP